MGYGIPDLSVKRILFSFQGNEKFWGDCIDRGGVIVIEIGCDAHFGNPSGEPSQTESLSALISGFRV